MTVYAATDGIAVGQPINPNFGAANGVAAAPVITQPTKAPIAGGLQATGVQMPVLEAMSRGILPRNAMVASVSGVNTAAGISNTNGDAMSVDEALGDGNGAQVNLGTATPNASGNGTTLLANPNNQQFEGAISDAAATLANGPTPTNTECLTSGPTPTSTTTANLSLVANSFAG